MRVGNLHADLEVGNTVAIDVALYRIKAEDVGILHGTQLPRLMPECTAAQKRESLVAIHRRIGADTLRRPDATRVVGTPP